MSDPSVYVVSLVFLEGSWGIASSFHRGYIMLR